MLIAPLIVPIRFPPMSRHTADADVVMKPDLKNIGVFGNFEFC